MTTTTRTDIPRLTEALTIAADARIMMRWWWFGPAMTRAEVTRQLMLMRDAGIGGVEVAYIYPVALEGEVEGVTNTRFLSPAFRDALRFAADEARRLGLRFDLTLGSGWPFGGPHITAQHAAKHLGTRVIDIPRDAATVPLPPLGEDETLLLAAGEDGHATAVEDGRLRIDAPSPVASQAILLIASPTGQQVKRAAVGAEGLVLDHYSEAALRAHLDAVGGPLLDAAGPGRVRAVFTDSLEVYASNWTDTYLAEFERRRGYDLAEFLPMLVAALHCHKNPSAAVTSDPHREHLIRDVQHDYAQTLTELLNDRFLLPLQRFAHDHGVLSRVQAYGVPPATLSSYHYVDLPEGETTLGASEIQQPAPWTEITPNRIAASASRSKPHNIVSGETWTRLHSPPYAATPLDMKAEADQFFLQGVNQILGHGWCHRPADGDPTQWVFYAAGNFNEVNPWCPVMPDLCRYLQTVSSLLRAGEPVVDVAIYLPDHDVWASRTLSPSKTNLHHVNALREHIGLALPGGLLRLGFNFDLADDDVLQTLADAEAPATRYRVVVLPRIERIPLATLEALQRLAKRSVTIVAFGRTPDQPIGRADRARGSDAVGRLSRALFSGSTPNVYHVAESNPAGLRRWCAPDVEFKQTTPAVGYVHRRIGEDDLYFFANTTNRSVRLESRFREPRQYTYRLNPMTHTACPADAGFLMLQAFESIVLLRSPHERLGDGVGDFRLRQVPPASPAEERDLSDGWELTSPGGGRIRCGRPRPWTDWEALRSYAGAATYSRILHARPQWVGRRIELVFNDPTPIAPHRLDPARRNTGFMTFLDTPIKDAAEVVLNGDRVASLFCPPYRVDLTGLIKAGENLLEIKVYNRLINALAGDAPYDFTPMHEAYGQRFDAIQDFHAVHAEPAGLAGAVSLHLFE